jgi:hypothetical protein
VYFAYRTVRFGILLAISVFPVNTLLPVIEKRVIWHGHAISKDAMRQAIIAAAHNEGEIFFPLCRCFETELYRNKQQAHGEQNFSLPNPFPLVKICETCGAAGRLRRASASRHSRL